jgi:hypothetical protein
MNTKQALLSELDIIGHDNLNPDAMMIALYRHLVAQGATTHQIVELFYRGSRKLLEQMPDHVQPSGIKAAVHDILQKAKQLRG